MENMQLTYTSKDVAQKLYITESHARKFLRDNNITPIEQGTKPLHYTKIEYEKAIEMYKSRYSEKLLKRKEMLEHARAEEEENRYLEYRHYIESKEKEITTEADREKEYIEYLVDKRFKENLPIFMLDSLIRLHGKTFNKSMLKKDITLDMKYEYYRNPGDMRSIDHIEALERLNDPMSYLEDDR